MKIWVIGRGYPTPENKMWGSFELEQAKMLARGGHDVSFIALTLSFFSRKDKRGMQCFEDEGVRVYAYSHLYFPGKAGIYLEGFEDKCWRKLFDACEKQSGQPDVIHVHYPSMISSINEIERLRRRGVKLYVTEHWSRVLINTLKSHELARLRYYAGSADCFAAVSETLMNAVRKLADVTVPTKVIPNIVSPVFFDAKGEKSDGSFTFISVGRLAPLKQFDVVIKQFLSEFSGNDRVRLRIIGSGSERAKLEHIAAGSSQIAFTGELSLKKVAEELASADALVSYSRYETFAAPVTEAWACGKPAIVSDASGVAAFVNRENGMVVPAKNPDQLGAAMRAIYENRDAYSAAAITGYAASHFNDEAVLGMLNEMYNNR